MKPEIIAIERRLTNKATAAERGIELQYCGHRMMCVATQRERRALRARSRAFQNLADAPVALVIGILVTTPLDKNDSLSSNLRHHCLYVRGVESNGEEERRCRLAVCSWAGVLLP